MRFTDSHVLARRIGPRREFFLFLAYADRNSGWIMRTAKIVPAIVALLFIPVAAVDASIRVTFINPEQYHDEDFRSLKRDGIIAEFQKEFERLDRRFIKKGQTLIIDVLDVELAGRYEPWRTGFNDVRILRNITPPSFKLRGRNPHRYELSFRSLGPQFQRSLCLREEPAPRLVP
jgi:hypothetical protein